MSKLAIEIKGLEKFYGKFQALYGVDLEVNQGEIFGFLGPNGAGKTTTIRCLLDLIRPQAGTMKVLGLDPATDSLEIRKQIGYLPGELNLEESLRVRQQIRYYNDLRGGGADWAYIEELAERMDLDLNRQIKNLSKGNKQKIGVIQTLMHKPKLVLMDEPTSGLDPLIQQEVYRMLREAQENGTTVFFSSHIISEVEALAERVAIIRKGVIVEEADPSDLKSMVLRRFVVRFKEQPDLAPFEASESISVLPGSKGRLIRLQLEGEVDELIRILAGMSIQDLDVERPSLEEIFLAYYEGGDFYDVKTTEVDGNVD